LELREDAKWDVLDRLEWNENIAQDPELAPVWRIGFCAVMEGVLKYDDYLAFQARRELRRHLSEKEWFALTVHSLSLLTTVWEDYLDLGLQVSKQTHVEMCRCTRSDWRAC
jgi:hypothetical protein